MCHHESQWLDNCPPAFKPVLYRRYVDDTFLLFRDTSHVDCFLTYLNSKHSSINFTCEMENNGKLPFLDLMITRGDRFATSIYRKPTFTGLYTNFASFIPEKFKHNIVRNLCDRICRLSSSFDAVHAELEKIKSLLLLNGYPLRLIQSKINEVITQLVSSSTKPIVHTCAKKEIYLTLPFTGKHSLSVRNKVRKFFQHNYPQINLKVILKPSFRLSDLFQFKDRLPIDVHSQVVYLYSCGSCPATYIGKTARHFKQRVCEHLGISARTGTPLQVKVHSAIRDHCEQSGHPLVQGNFRILTNAESPQDLLS